MESNSTPRFGALSSSVNPQEIALRVKGIIVALSSVIVLIAGSFFDVTLMPDDVLDLATQLGGVAGAIATIYGAIQWGLVRFYERKARE